MALDKFWALRGNQMLLKQFRTSTGQLPMYTGGSYFFERILWIHVACFFFRRLILVIFFTWASGIEKPKVRLHTST